MSDDPGTHFVSVHVDDYAALRTRITELEDVARAVVKANHTNACWRERQKKPVADDYCDCQVKQAQKALGVDG